jgi:hypothetical protein
MGESFTPPTMEPSQPVPTLEVGGKKGQRKSVSKLRANPNLQLLSSTCVSFTSKYGNLW